MIPMSFRKTNIFVIYILILLSIVLSCNKSISIQRSISSKIPARTAGRNAAIKEYNKNGIINVCLIPTWYGENNREFINDSCSCKIFEELKRHGITTKRKKIELDSDNNHYEITYWSSYKTTMEWIDKLC